jgi:hypothetical protein
MASSVQQAVSKKTRNFAPQAVQQLRGGQVVATYPSVNQASIENFIPCNDIRECMLGKRDKAGEFEWRPVLNGAVQEKISPINNAKKLTKREKADALRTKKCNLSNAKPVQQLQGDRVLATFPSILRAQNETGALRDGIRECCNGEKDEEGGFQWMWLPKSQDSTEEGLIELGTEARAQIPGKDTPQNETASDKEQWIVPKQGLAFLETGGWAESSHKAVSKSLRDDTSIDSRETEHSPSETESGDDSAASPRKKRPNDSASSPRKKTRLHSGDVPKRPNRGGAQKRAVYKLRGGLVVSTYPSTMEAANKTNTSRHAIRSCCMGKQDEAGGFGWKFVVEEGQPFIELTDADRASPEEELGEGSARPSKKSRRAERVAFPVQQLQEGHVVATYQSLTKASNATGVSYRVIRSCCSTRNKVGGFEWKRLSDNIAMSSVKLAPVTSTQPQPNGRVRVLESESGAASHQETLGNLEEWVARQVGEGRAREVEAALEASRPKVLNRRTGIANAILNRTWLLRLVTIGSLLAAWFFASDARLAVFYIADRLLIRRGHYAFLFLVLGVACTLVQAGLGLRKLLFITFLCGAVFNYLVGDGQGQVHHASNAVGPLSMEVVS